VSRGQSDTDGQRGGSPNAFSRYVREALFPKLGEARRPPHALRMRV
jgi:hypothetical protein